MKCFLRYQLTALIVLVLLCQAAHAGDRQPAYVPGEILHYKLWWGFIPAGEATLRVMPVKTIGGEQVYHFVMQARTNAFADAFYRFRGRIDAYADMGMTRSIKYVKNTQVGGKRKIDTVDFNWEQKSARFHRREEDKGPPPETEEHHKVTALMPGAFDPLSAMYYTRTVRLDGNTYLEHPVTDGKKCVLASAHVLKREQIRINGTTRDSYLVLPDLKNVRGVFQKSKNARILIWVSADQYQIPLRIKSKVVVGSFTGELVRAERPISAARAQPAYPAAVTQAIH